MSHNPRITNDKFGSIRIVNINGEPWFVLKDVSEALNYDTPNRARRLLEDYEKGGHIVASPGGNQKMTIVNESGLYSLIIKSRKPEAKEFKKWVTTEVLPSIRKQG